MPFLREAVEKKRREFISILMNAGVLRNSDKEYQKWTFTELKTECKRLQINNKKMTNRGSIINKEEDDRR
ncbi:hypothetical protein CVD25_19535 [Bacillus canaveralius]|uniref:Fur-regulated basic protein FbpA n=1 Tax=Bacillus canaveralius TaxID=1403243 RepID=A0A2N5GIP8_9BACI|nr:hypothetical protein [Bacillus canaveralius]PLR80896.1 hypothetical protein CU635_16650 [Bacillus canaveralius]PLR91184.1 hypothetical protein CVD25_19535 [Bacillus canaveralius]